LLDSTENKNEKKNKERNKHVNYSNKLHSHEDNVSLQILG